MSVEEIVASVHRRIARRTLLDAPAYPPPLDEILVAEITRLRALLAECADELEAYINEEHRHRERYASGQLKWERDMDIVRRVRAEISTSEAGDDSR